MNHDEQLIDEASQESFPASDPPSWTMGIGPAMQVGPEPGDHYVFTIDLPPGVGGKDIDVSLTGNLLVISSPCEAGSFGRAFTLPEGSDLEQVSARLEKGVLRLSAPRKPIGPPRRIPITEGEG